MMIFNLSNGFILPDLISTYPTLFQLNQQDFSLKHFNKTNDISKIRELFRCELTSWSKQIMISLEKREWVGFSKNKFLFFMKIDKEWKKLFLDSYNILLSPEQNIIQ